MTNKRTAPRLILKLLGIVLVLCLLSLLWPKHPLRMTQAVNDVDHIPFVVTGQLQIGADGTLLKHNTLTLVCNGENVHLLLRSSLPPAAWELPAEVARGASGTSYNLPMTLFVDGVEKDVELNGETLETGTLQTIVTAPLTQGQLDDQQRWMPNRMGFHLGGAGDVGEMAVYLDSTEKATSEAIADFRAECQMD